MFEPVESHENKTQIFAIKSHQMYTLYEEYCIKNNIEEKSTEAMYGNYTERRDYKKLNSSCLLISRKWPKARNMLPSYYITGGFQVPYSCYNALIKHCLIDATKIFIGCAKMFKIRKVYNNGKVYQFLRL